MDRVQSRGRNARLLGIALVLVALTTVYVLTVREFNVTDLPLERHFGAAGEVVPAGEVYLEPISIDALNDAMQVRAYVSPSTSESKNADTASVRDVTVLVSHDNTVEEIKLAAGDHIASFDFRGRPEWGQRHPLSVGRLRGAARRPAHGRKVLPQASG